MLQVASDDIINNTGITLANPTGVAGTYALRNQPNITGYGWDTAIVNGELVSGTVLQLGPGKDVETVAAALNRFTYGVPLLILAYPGIYGDILVNTTYHQPGQKIYIKAMTDNPNDVVFSNSSSAVDIWQRIDLIIEGCTLSSSSSYQGCTTRTSANGSKIIFNKCILNFPNIVSYGGICVQKNPVAWTLPITCSYCNIQSGSILIGSSQNYPLYNRDNITLRKTISNTDYTRYMTGIFALADYKFSPADGYGYNYGDFLILPASPIIDRHDLSWGGGTAQSVTEDGVYTLSDGSNTIEATVDYSALAAENTTDNVRVFEELLSISVNPPSKYIRPGDALQYSVIGNYELGVTRDITSQVTDWESSDTSIATILSSGIAKAVATGKTTIKAVLGALSDTVLLMVRSVLPRPPQIVAFSSQKAYRSAEYLTKRFKFPKTSLSLVKVIASAYPVELDVVYPKLSKTLTVVVTSKRPKRIKSFLVDCCEVRIRTNSQVSAVFLASSMDELPL